jgi:hypothetical protein
MQKLLGTILGASMCLASAAFAAPAPVTLCHLPPGNAGSGFHITVGGSAVRAHLAHGDFLPLTCDDIDDCGPQDDGCGGALECGSCCLTCAGVGSDCGGLDDGCGHILDCGTCLPGDKCVFDLGHFSCGTQH